MKKKIRRWLELGYHHLVTIVFTVLGTLPKKELFFFESFHGKQYSDNPRAFYEYIRENHPEIQCVWAVKKGFEQPLIEAGVPYVRRMGIRWLFTMPRAKYWIFNTRMPLWMKKTKGTIYVQTWHGTPLKKLGLDIDRVNMPDTDTARYKNNFIEESRRWDYLISPNRYSTDTFRTAFDYSDNILEIGYPRNELLIERKDDFNYCNHIKGKLGIQHSMKVVLYAPTWRDNQFFSKGSYKFENQFPFDEVLKDNPNCVIVLRTHYLIANSIDISRFHGRVINASSYSDIRELYLISDCLVTDYSSVMFDYAFTKRPMLFYMYDLEEYSDVIRGFYFDPETELPGPIATNKHQLLQEFTSIFDLSDDFYDERYQDFYNKFCRIKSNGTPSENLFMQLKKNTR